MSVQTPGMIVVLAIATAVCILANASIAVADYAKASFVLANSAEVGVRPSAVPYLATLKLAGALGLAIGFAGVPWLGLASGLGLVLFFVGAVVVHIRAKVFHNIGFPGVYLVLAIAAACYFARAAGVA